MYRLQDKNPGEYVRVKHSLTHYMIVEKLSQDDFYLDINGEIRSAHISDISLNLKETLANKVDHTIESFQLFIQHVFSGAYDRKIKHIAIIIVFYFLGILTTLI